MSDVYEFAKSNEVQGVGDQTPYVSKQWQYVNDINSGVYSNNGISLVQFDLSSLYNSSSFVDINQGYFVIPITYVQALGSNFTGTLVTPTGTGGDQMRLGLKSGFFNLVHACEIMVNGQTLDSYQPYLNAYTGFKMLSQMSQDDLNSYGFSLGMGNKVDNPASLKFNNNASQVVTGTFGTTTTANGPVGGNGITNNAPFASASNFGDQAALGAQNSTAYNNGLFSRLNRIVDLQGNAGVAVNTLYGSTTYGQTIQSSTNLANEFRPAFQLLNTSYMVWYDYAVIRIGDILDSMQQMPLVKKFDGIVRLSLNVGVVGVQHVSAATGNQMTSATASTFTNTCPLVVPSLLAVPSTGGTAICSVSGLFIGKATTTNQFGINLGSSGASNPMNACRFYFPQVVLKPERALSYVSENRNKQLSYTSMLYNQASAITAGGTYSGLIQSGVSNIRGVLILPFISSSTHGLMNVASGVAVISGISAFAEMLSPFSQAPMQTAPISLINLSVAVGGQNVMQNFLSFGFETFLEQVSLYDKINGSSLGLSCGLISQYMWEQAYRSYYIDCSRGNLGDAMTPRNVNVTFTNNSQQTIDCLIFVEYYNSRIIDVETGLIRS